MARKPKEAAQEKLDLEEPGTIPANNENLDAVGTDIEQLPEGMHVRDSLSDQIQSFMSRANYEQLQSRLYIYKYVNPADTRAAARRITQTRIDIQSVDDIPDEHSIGMEFGSGKYLCILQVPRGAKQEDKQSMWIVWCAAHYDEYKRQAAINAAGNNGGRPANVFQKTNAAANQVPNILQVPSADNSESLKNIVALVKDLMPKEKGPDIAGAAMISNFQMMNQVMRNQFLENIRMMQAFQAKTLDLTGDIEEREEEIAQMQAIEAAKMQGGGAAPGILQGLVPFAPFIVKFLDGLTKNNAIDPSIIALADVGKKYLAGLKAQPTPAQAPVQKPIKMDSEQQNEEKEVQPDPAAGENDETGEN